MDWDAKTPNLYKAIIDTDITTVQVHAADTIRIFPGVSIRIKLRPADRWSTVRVKTINRGENSFAATLAH